MAFSDHELAVYVCDGVCRVLVDGCKLTKNRGEPVSQLRARIPPKCGSFVFCWVSERLDPLKDTSTLLIAKLDLHWFWILFYFIDFFIFLFFIWCFNNSFNPSIVHLLYLVGHGGQLEPVI